MRDPSMPANGRAFQNGIGQTLRRAPTARTLRNKGRPAFGGTALGAKSNASDRLVAALVDQLVLRDPRHHGAQRFADGLDLVGIVHAANALEASCAGLVLLHPLGRELAG